MVKKLAVTLRSLTNTPKVMISIALSESKAQLSETMPNVWRYLEGSTQLEAFYERYQREGVPNDLTMQAFCSMHNVPYNCFERHVRQRAKFRNIKPVMITGLPEEERPTEAVEPAAIVETDLTPVLLTDADAEEKLRILVTIKMSNGFQIHRSNIDYRTLLGYQFVTVRTTATAPATVPTP